MPPRLNKRQQRELEELETLKLASNTDNLDDGSDEDEPTPDVGGASAQKPGFAALLAANIDDGDDDILSGSDADSKPAKKKSKKKKKSTTHTKLQTVSRASPSPAPSKPQPSLIVNEKKASKKAKAKARKAGAEEFDKALAELNSTYGAPSNTAGPSTLPHTSRGKGKQTFVESIVPLIAPQTSNLDPEAELIKFFGSKVIHQNRSSSAAPRDTRSRRAAAVAAKHRGGTVLPRSTFTKPIEGWFHYSQLGGSTSKGADGLSIRLLRPEEVSYGGPSGWLGNPRPLVEDTGEQYYTFEYDKRYKSVTKSFLHVVASGDPQGFYELVAREPWHGDTLLQFSEIYRHREEHASASDALARALFAFERPLLSVPVPSDPSLPAPPKFDLQSGLCRLSFAHVQNRPLFLAIQRHIVDLQRRGCPRTAFEWARVLWGLDLGGDPHGALFWLEYLGIKVTGDKGKDKEGVGRWLVDVFEAFERRRETQGEDKDAQEGRGRADPSVLPGWMYARALLLRMRTDTKDRESADSALIAAVKSFPEIVVLLADKLDASLPTSIRGMGAFKINTDPSDLNGGKVPQPQASIIHLLANFYVQRSWTLWKDHTSWFTQTIIGAFGTATSLPESPQRKRFIEIYRNTNAHYAAYRHLVVCESTSGSSSPWIRPLFKYIPPLLKANIESNNLACDPVPPYNAATQYDADFFQGVDEIESLVARALGSERQRQRALERAIPDPRMREQLHQWFHAIPQLRERFPGAAGFVDFALRLGEMGDEALEDLVMAAQMEMVDGREMPGGLGDEGLDVSDGEQEQGQGGDDEENDDDDEEEDEEVMSTTVRAVRNVFRRFWGRSGAEPAGESDTSEDEENLPLSDTDSID